MFMNKRCAYILTVFCCFFFNSAIASAIVSENIQPEMIMFPKDHGKHTLATEEVWMFSGEVASEDGKRYAYMYQLKRKDKKLSVFTNIVDLSMKKTKEVLLYKKDQLMKDNTSTKKSASSKKSAQSIEWKVGKAFMKYNIIGDSWFFGVLDEKNGFNFRVKGVRTYVLNGKDGYLMQKKEKDKKQAFKASYSAQSMNINGHLTFDGESSFVTGKNSWFEHHWGTGLSGHQATKYALITCRFNDNTGLMLYEWFGKKDLWPVQLKTGTYQNALDEKMLLSNFSLAKSTKTRQWLISIPALKINIAALGDTIPEYDVIQVKNNKNGYCFVNQRGF